HFMQNIELKLRMNVPQEQHVRRAIGFRNLRTKRLEHVELGIQGMGFVQLVRVFTLPTKRRSWTPFQAGEIDPSAFEKRDVLLRKILSNHGNERHRGKEAGSC